MKALRPRRAAPIEWGLLGWIGGSVLIFVACVCAAAFFVGCSKRDIPTTAPKPALTAWVSVTGKSMLPTFPVASLVEAEFGVPYEALKQGDTVIFWDYTNPKPAYTMHRLVAKQAGNWIAQGDNPETNPRADTPWVTPDNYVARTTGRHTQVLFAPKP